MSEPNPVITPATPGGTSVVVAERATRVSLFRRLLSHPVGLISIIILALVVLSAILA